MSAITIGPAKFAERAAACRWLFDDARAERTLELLASGGLDADGLFVARATGVCGAVLVQPLGGALGLAWPPRAESPAVEDALLAAGREWLHGGGVRACQAFAAADELPAFAPLIRGGFRCVTRLIPMRRDATPVPRDELRIAVRPVLPDDRDEFARTLLATYVGSLDCPELNAVRSADALDGMPARCFLARYEGRPVGVLALGDADGVRELAYLGVIPEARGRGFGDELLRYAIGRDGDETALHLSVDARNEPALRLYRRLGFVEGESRAAFLAVW